MTWRYRIRNRRVAVSVAGTLLSAALPALGAQDLPIELKVRPVALSESLPDGEAIGRIRPRGLLELPAFKIGGMRFSQLSGLAWDDDDGVLYAISDKGYLFHLRPIVKDGLLIGVTLLKAAALTEVKNGKPLRDRRADSEGLEILHGRNGIRGDAELLVSFERFARIVRYRPDGKALGELALPAALMERDVFREPNEMLEAVCADSEHGVLTVSEQPLKNEPAGTTRLFSLSGGAWRYPLTGKSGISALECLGEGRVLAIERDFGYVFRANTITLKLVALPPTPISEPLAPATVATLDTSKGHQIDNFEGLARHKGNRFFMVSDDNDLFVQRTLLLYFELLPDPAPQAPVR